MARSLNKVELIGNLTRDPELRYTPQGTAVCTFGVATNRSWTTDSGEKREDVDFHRIVAWNKLGELCSQLLSKGRKVYVEGRIQTRNWSGQDGAQRQTTEIIITDMIILDSRRDSGDYSESAVEEPEDFSKAEPVEEESKKTVSKKVKDEKKSEKKAEVKDEEEINPDDIPF